MIFNCTHCGISISTKRVHCPYCKADNLEMIELMSGVKSSKEKLQLNEKVKGTILSFVLR